MKGPGFDFLANPKGDMAVAEKYMKEAGYASGKYDGNEELLMVTANVDPGKAQAEVAKAQLEKLGFKIRLRTVPQDAVYTEWCQQPAKKVAVCGSRGLVQGLQRPAVDARADVQGLERSRRTAATTTWPQLRRSEDRQGHGRGGAARGRRALPRPGARSTR